MGYGSILNKSAVTWSNEQILSSATAGLYNLGTDAVPNNVFNILSKAALYKTVASTQQLGSIAEGQIIYLNENGSPVPFYVAKQGYEPNYNTDRVLVVRKDAVTSGVWNVSANTYDGSTIDTWFNSTYLATLDGGVQTSIGTTNIPYTPMDGSSSQQTVQRISKSIFALSVTEFGLTKEYANVEGSALPIASELRIGKNEQGSTITQWSRSPQYTKPFGGALSITQGGAPSLAGLSNEYYYRPAFTLPSTFTAYTEEPTTGFYDVSDNLILQLPGVQIETGSYVGTGTYGAKNPSSLDFSFDPQFIMIYPNNTYAGGNQSRGVMFPKLGVFGSADQNSFPAMQYTNISVTNGTVTWYRTTSADQLNTAGVKYYYFAIG